MLNPESEPEGHEEMLDILSELPGFSGAHRLPCFRWALFVYHRTLTRRPHFNLLVSIPPSLPPTLRRLNQPQGYPLKMPISSPSPGEMNPDLMTDEARGGYRDSDVEIVEQSRELSSVVDMLRKVRHQWPENGTSMRIPQIELLRR